MRILGEFKAFAVRGNVVELAVGVIIGAAFGGVVTSLVNDVILPPIGALTGGIDFTDKSFVLLPERDTPFEGLWPGGKATDPPPAQATSDPAASQPKKKLPAVELRYGKFLQAVLNFGIVAVCLFLVVKGMNALKRREEEKPSEPTPTEKLLAEIRDELKSGSTERGASAPRAQDSGG